MKAATAQFYGGPYDGLLRAVGVGADGTPPLLIEAHESTGSLPALGTVDMRTVRYRRWGLSSSGHEWLYVHPDVQVPPIFDS